VGPFTCEGSSGRPHITFSRPQNTANHSWSTAYHHLKTRKHRKSLPKDRKSLFQEGRKLQNHIFHIATANQCCWLSQDHKIPQITAGRPKIIALSSDGMGIILFKSTGILFSKCTVLFRR